MRKLLQQAAVGIVTLVVLPALANVLLEGARAAGWIVGTGGVMSAAAIWLAAFVASQQYLILLAAALAFAAGIVLDLAARRVDGTRRSQWEALASRAEQFRDRLGVIRREFASGDVNAVHDMTLAYADLIAFQRTLEREGLKMPWVHWDREMPDPVPCLNTYIGLFALVAPLLRDGHLREAKTVCRRAINWNAPKGPTLNVGGGELRRIF